MSNEPRLLSDAFEEAATKIKQMLASTDEKVRLKASSAAIKLIDTTDKWKGLPVKLYRLGIILLLFCWLPGVAHATGCANVDFQMCWDGCRASTCGFLGSGAVISFSMETPGAFYSSCSSTGANCSFNPDDGHACQSKSIMLSYRDCQGNANAIAGEPCCEAGMWEAASSKTTNKALCLAVDSLLPIPVGVPR